MFIYRMRCAATGKVYIGMTTRTVAMRVSEHFDNASRYSGGSRHLYNAIRKYPCKSQWVIETIANACTIEELKALEIELIAIHGSMNRLLGYNATVGGDGINGFEFTPEMREKARIRSTGRKMPESAKQKLRDLHKDPIYSAKATTGLREHKHSAAFYAALGEKFRGRVVPPETRLRISKKLIGIKRSPEHIAKSVFSRIGFKKTPEQIESSAKFHRGRKRSQTTRDLLRDSMLRRHKENPSAFHQPGDPERDMRIAADYCSSNLSFEKVGEKFGIKGAATHQAVLRVRCRIADAMAAANVLYENAPLPPSRMHPSFLEFAV